MARVFEIRREVPLAASPETVWDAVATGPGQEAWLWPVASGDLGPATEWDPPRRFVTRVEKEGWFNQLEFGIEGRPDGTAVLRYVHSGIFTGDWDNQYDGASKHTDFYLHTLGAYLRHFPGQRAQHVSVTAPDSSATPAALSVLRKDLGVEGTSVGDTVSVAMGELPAIEAVVEYADEWFLGLRFNAGLICVFARGAWGGPLEIVSHVFDAAAPMPVIEAAIRTYLDDLYS